MMRICVECEFYREDQSNEKTGERILHACISEKDPVTGKGKIIDCRKNNKTGKCKQYIAKEGK